MRVRIRGSGTDRARCVVRNYETGDVPAHMRDVLNKCAECGATWTGPRGAGCGACSQPKQADEGRSDEQIAADYKEFRGRCKELVDAAIAADGTLTAVRGHYYCHIFGEQPHWWCVTTDGTVFDPSARQFPSNGKGAYVPFDGYFECSNCGKSMREEEVSHHESNYVFCSTTCHMRFVGL